MYNDTQVDLTEQVKQILAEQGVPLKTDADARPQQPITVDLGGQQYTFATQEELTKTLGNAYQALIEQNSTLMAQLEEFSKNSQTKTETNSSDEPKFDYATFAEYIQKDPVKAFDYIDEIRYGKNKVNPIVEETLQRLEETQRKLDVYAFLNAHPEFNNTDANAQKLYAVMNSLGLQPDLRGLEVAYRTAQAYQIPFEVKGGYENTGRFGQQPQQNMMPQQQQMMPQNQAVAPPPSINRNGQTPAPASTEDYLNQLNNDQLLALIRQGM